MTREQAYATWKAILRRYGTHWDWVTFNVCHPEPCRVLRQCVEIVTGEKVRFRTGGAS